MSHLGVVPAGETRLHQGDIFKDVSLPLMIGVPFEDGNLVPEVRLVPAPWVLVVTQECDLQQDHAARNGLVIAGESPVSRDKELRAVVLIPGWGSSEVKAGTYVPGVTSISSKRWSAVENNESPRYYHVPAQEGLLDNPITFDLKLYSTVPAIFAESEWSNARFASLKVPWREHVTRHFANYLSRIALPDEFAPTQLAGA